MERKKIIQYVLFGVLALVVGAVMFWVFINYGKGNKIIEDKNEIKDPIRDSLNAPYKGSGTISTEEVLKSINTPYKGRAKVSASSTINSLNKPYGVE